MLTHQKAPYELELLTLSRQPSSSPPASQNTKYTCRTKLTPNNTKSQKGKTSEKKVAKKKNHHKESRPLSRSKIRHPNPLPHRCLACSSHTTNASPCPYSCLLYRRKTQERAGVGGWAETMRYQRPLVVSTFPEAYLGLGTLQDQQGDALEHWHCHGRLLSRSHFCLPRQAAKKLTPFQHHAPGSACAEAPLAQTCPGLQAPQASHISPVHVCESQINGRRPAPVSAAGETTQRGNVSYNRLSC